MAITNSISKKNLFFEVNKSELEDRFDAPFYKEGFDFTDFIKLSKVAKIAGGKRLPEGYDFSDVVTRYRYLRVGDVSWDGTLNYKSFKYISEQVYKILKRYEIFNNDLLIAIVGATVGKVSLLEIETDENVILTENCAKVSVKDDSVLPKYLAIIIQSKIVQKQIQLNYIQTTLPKLGLDRLASLHIPKIPSKEIQLEVINLYYAAYNKKKQKEVQVTNLLKKIDSYILNELGISLPEADNSQGKRMFVSNFSDVVGLRLDPLYFKNIGKIESEIFENVSLRKILAINKGQSITKEKITEGEFPVIAGGQSSPYFHNLSNFDGNIITISASGAYSGYVWYHNYPIFASDCIVLQSKNEQEVNTEFVYFVLKALQQEIYKMQQGAGQPHVYARDIEKMTIPVPALSKQLDMLKHIQNIQQQIKTLQSEAVSILDNAKAEVEKMILG